ncbi:hypothetical protein [Thalassolituus marinus]|uniref:Uncharacterized protein n=1 Tax=Thalassolituus marinus TaxID=671053 RepID=A0ABS7ZR81_9GAMM|nr:hypothetical protein [Thalassolituus marinus]MCA6064195.1 hypothetical protein [Thalassolituus marinus]
MRTLTNKLLCAHNITTSPISIKVLKITNPNFKTEEISKMSRNFESLLIKRDEWNWSYEKVFVKPNIPHKKLMNALGYASGVRPEDVLLLIDDTVFGGAKDGMLVTSDAIYCHEIMTSPVKISFKDITEVGMDRNSQVLVNKRNFFKANIVDHLALLTITSRINAVLKEVRGEKESSEVGTNEREKIVEKKEASNSSNEVKVSQNKYALNFISSDEYFSAIKKIDNINKASSVASIFLGDANKDRPITKITDDFTKKIYKAVFLFRTMIVDESRVNEFANDLATVEVECYTAANLIKYLLKHSVPEAVLSSIMETAIPDALFIKSEKMQDLVLSIIKSYIQDDEPIVMFTARLFICNKEKRLVDEISNSMHQIIDIESREFNDQFTNFTAGLERMLTLFDNKVNTLTKEFVSNTLNTVHKR